MKPNLCKNYHHNLTNCKWVVGEKHITPSKIVTVASLPSEKSWYEFVKNYIDKLKSSSLEEQLDSKHNKDLIPSTAHALDKAPDMMKAQGIGGDYKKETSEMPFNQLGNDNFILPNYYN